MSTQYLRCILVASILMLAPRAHALPGESIMLDPNTGNYTITYFGYDESGESEERTALRVATFEPATKIDPTVRSTLKMGANGIVAYRYRIHNGTASRQPLVMILFDPIPSLIATDSSTQPELDTQPNAIAHNWGVASYPIMAPEGWNGWATTSRLGGLRAGWDSIEASLPPGMLQNGFGLFSNDLPGIGAAQLRGKSAIRKFVDEGPIGEVGIQLRKLVQNNYVPRNAAVPTIAVTVPFDAAVVLERIQAHAHTWITQQLIDPAFSSQLDRYFQSAISAYRLNQPKAGKKHIQTMRELIKKEHADADREDDSGEMGDDGDKTKRPLIDKLAARILDFDLKYVTKRMGGDKDD